MSYRVVDLMGEWTDRQTGARAVMAELSADTANDLPVNAANLQYVLGSWARTVDTGDIYRINSSGIWVLQPSTNMWQNVYTKAEVDTMVNTIYQIMMYYHTAQESANGSITFYTLGTPVGSLTIYGNGQKTGTPTPDAPIMPTFCGVRTPNLIDESKVTPNAYITTTGDTGSTDASNLSDFIDINGSTFAISGVRTIAIIRYASRALCYFDSDKNYISGVPYDPDVMTRPVIFSRIPSNAKYVRFTFDKAFENGIMLNTGSTALPYEPFGHKIPISCGGETVPVYLGQTQTVRRVKKYEFTGQETMYEYGGTGVGARIPMSDMMQNMRTDGFCTHFVPFSAPAQATGDNITFGVPGSNNIYIIMSQSSQQSTGVSDFTGFKSYLAQQYAAGNPVTVWYVLATPTTGIVNEPLCKIGTYADELHITDADVSIPTVSGENTLTVDTTLPPSKIVISGESN